METDIEKIIKGANKNKIKKNRVFSFVYRKTEFIILTLEQANLLNIKYTEKNK